MLKYQEIVTHIEKQIAGHVLCPGMKLPSLRETAEKFSASIGTVLTAYQYLEQHHHIYSIPKSGYYVVGALDEEASKPNGVIDFYSGAPDSRYIPFHDFQHCVDQAMELCRQVIFTYADVQGLPLLLNTLENYFTRYQIYTHASNIIITSGSQQALDILCRMPFPNGKKTILLEQPTYYGMIRSVYLCGSSAIGISRSFQGIRFDELERLFYYGDIKFFYTIPRYHNPTGHSYTKSEKTELLRLAHKYNVYIVEDDIAADFDTNSKNDPLYYYDSYDRVIYIKSFSKVLMPGLRVSAIIVPDLIKNTFLEYKEWTDTYTSILSQGSLAVYLGSGMFDKYHENLRSLYMNRMDVLRRTVEENPVPDLEWNIPDSGFFSCVKLKQDTPFEKLQPMLIKNNIRLMDTSGFFLKEFRNNHYYRVSVSKANDNADFILMQITTYYIQI